jgi:hypothetical protein
MHKKTLSVVSKFTYGKRCYSSDVGVSREVNHGTNNITCIRVDTSYLPQVNNFEPSVIEADSMSVVNSLIKCRMEEMLVKWQVHFRVQNCLVLGS